MEKFKPIRMLVVMLASILFNPILSYGQCDPPEAYCMDVTVTLDSAGQYILDPSEVDVGSTAPCGLQNMTLDNAIFTCDDVNPSPSPAALFFYEAGDSILQNAGEIKVDALGNVYVADINDDVIKKFDAAGNYLGNIGVKGFGVGQFASLRGIEVDASGNIYGTDDNRDKILVFNPAGAFQFEFGASGTGSGQFTNPWRLSVSSSGIYVTDNVQDKILVFDGSGNFQFEFGSFGTNPGDLDNPANIDHDSSDNVYVLDQHRRKVIKYDAAGNFINEFGQVPSGGVFEGRLDIVEGLAIGNDGNIYVADRSSSIQNNKIMVFDNGGNFIYEFGNTGDTNGKFGWTYAVAVDGNDNLYVSDLIRDLYLVFDQAMVGNLVALTVTDVNGDSACCVAEVTVMEGNGCASSQDQDMDGYTPNEGDCDDTDPTIYPSAPDICDGKDNNCDGSTDEDLGTFSGNLVITSQSQLDILPIYSVINGNLNIINTDVTDLSNLNCLVEVKNGVHIYDNVNLTSIAGLETLYKAKGVTIRRNHNLVDVDGLSGLQDVGQDGIEISDNDGLTDATFTSLNHLGFDQFFNPVISIRENAILNSVSFPAIDSIRGWVHIIANPAITQLDFPILTEVGEQLTIASTSMTSISGFPQLTSVGTDLSLSSNNQLSDFGDLAHVAVGRSVFVNGGSFTSVNGLTNNTSITEQLRITGINPLTDISRLGSLTSIGTFFELSNNSQLNDCCAIAPLIQSGNVGSLILNNNGAFCSDSTSIITQCLDQDGDGFSPGDGDCDDSDASIYPGAPELCNLIDDDCDGIVDEDCDITIIPDPDFEQELIDLGIDSDGTINHQMFTIDAAGVTSLNLSGLGINDLTGIEAFDGLDYLDFKNNNVNNVDLSSLVAL